MSLKKLGIAVTLAAAAGGIALGGAAIADAATNTPTPSASSTTDGDRGSSSDTAVTGNEADKVIAAVKAKDSTATITSVRKDPDGTYDAIGTKSGNPVMYDVSTDLKTITQNTHSGSGHGPRSPNSSTPSATPSA